MKITFYLCSLITLISYDCLFGSSCTDCPKWLCSILYFIPLIFILLFILLWSFCTYTGGVPTTLCLRVPTNFYSANFYSTNFYSASFYSADFYSAFLLPQVTLVYAWFFIVSNLNKQHLLVDIVNSLLPIYHQFELHLIYLTNLLNELTYH